nr:ubiquitin carboxyl-terminal hydrolase 3 [Ipomoea trifida]
MNLNPRHSTVCWYSHKVTDRRGRLAAGADFCFAPLSTRLRAPPRHHLRRLLLAIFTRSPTGSLPLRRSQPLLRRSQPLLRRSQLRISASHPLTLSVPPSLGNPRSAFETFLVTTFGHENVTDAMSQFVLYISLDLVLLLDLYIDLSVLMLYVVDCWFASSEDERINEDNRTKEPSSGVYLLGVYFMKQTVGNACGTIALLHVVIISLQFRDKACYRNIIGAVSCQLKILNMLIQLPM